MAVTGKSGFGRSLDVACEHFYPHLHISMPVMSYVLHSLLMLLFTVMLAVVVFYYVLAVCT